MKRITLWLLAVNLICFGVSLYVVNYQRQIIAELEAIPRQFVVFAAEPDQTCGDKGDEQGERL